MNKLLSGNETETKLKLHIYLTLKRKMDTLPSFLFWRAFMLREKQKQAEIVKGRDTTVSAYQNPLTDGPVKIHLGRPNFQNILEEIADEEPYTHFVYGCGPPMITD